MSKLEITEAQLVASGQIRIQLVDSSGEDYSLDVVLSQEKSHHDQSRFAVGQAELYTNEEARQGYSEWPAQKVTITENRPIGLKVSR